MKAWSRFEGFVDQYFSRRLLLLLVAVNLGGTLFGFYYYIPQLSETPLHLWPLVPNSPLATIFFASSLLLILREGLESSLGLKNILYGLAFIGNVKYGLWTVFVLLYFMPEFMSIHSTPMYLMLILSHIGMFLQAFILLRYIHVDRLQLIPLTYVLFNDFMDYSLGIHTELPETQGLYSVVAAVAFGLTLTSGFIVYLKGYVKKKEVVKIRG